jgi:hypothetical protein
VLRPARPRPPAGCICARTDDAGDHQVDQEQHQGDTARGLQRGANHEPLVDQNRERGQGHQQRAERRGQDAAKQYDGHERRHLKDGAPIVRNDQRHVVAIEAEQPGEYEGDEGKGAPGQDIADALGQEHEGNVDALGRDPQADQNSIGGCNQHRGEERPPEALDRQIEECHARDVEPGETVSAIQRAQDLCAVGHQAGRTKLASRA